MSPAVHITACYTFLPLEMEDMRALHQELSAFGSEREMKGLVLLAPEGLNATVCGNAHAMTEWKKRMRTLAPDIAFKDSTAEWPVFRRWSLKLKREIVTLKQPNIRPRGSHNHVSPETWQAMLHEKDVVVLDARNQYEVRIGKFSGAVDPGIKTFSEFPDYVKRAALPKEKKILLYCTGGIRCEKAVLSMEAEGYTNVYQLEGGILAYLEKYPQKDFTGECFVFDERVAVDQQLQPSKTYTLCPTCGDPVHSSMIVAQAPFTHSQRPDAAPGQRSHEHSLSAEHCTVSL